MEINLSNNFFNPLAPVSGKKHCDAIFIVLVISLIVIIFSVSMVIGSLFSKTAGATAAAILILVQTSLIHHVYRIIYTMCINTV